MNTFSSASRFMRLGCAATLSMAALLCQAQAARPGLRVVPQPAAPAAATISQGAPNPAGLTSQFPAGLPSPGDTPPGSPATDAGIATPSTAVMGAGAAAPRAGTAGTGPVTALQIAQSFLGADMNRDGELTRAEAQRLTLAPYGFDEMDRNHDGVVTRFEYEDAVR